MKRIRLCLAALAGAAAGIAAADIIREGPMEKQPLFAPGTAQAWATSESSIQETNARSRGSLPSWHWHVSVDHEAGEPRYPIGWPRISRVIPPGEARDWSAWDFLRMWVYATTSRERLPSVPAGLGLHTPDRNSAYNRTLSELRKDEWVEIRIPLAQVPRHHDVRQLQFHIAESNYQHGDQIDFYIADLALLRYATPTLLELAPEQAVMFADTARVAVGCEVVGLKSGAEVPIFCELWRQGRVVARAASNASRGRQRLVLEAAGGPLAAGSYEVQAGIAGERQSASATVRLVESPWRETP